jgi:hypothetical protein
MWVLPLKIEIIESFGLFRSLPTKMQTPLLRLKDWGPTAWRNVRYLVRIVPPSDLSHGLLSSIKTVTMSVGVDAHNPKWTSYGALELDIFAPSRSDLETFLAAIEPLGTLEFVTDLNIPPHSKPDAQLFAEARSHFNSERYWECHEAFEGVWRLMSGEEKRYLQGIILVCAAFVHHQKGEGEAALSVLRRAARQLDYASRSYHGIDVNSLREHVNHIISSGRFETFSI